MGRQQQGPSCLFKVQEINMIFRRYTSFIIIICVCCIAAVVFAVSPYLSKIQPLKGNPQPSTASYPLKSVDRVLVALNGEWTAFNSLRGVNQAIGAVGEQVYGVSSKVYALGGSVGTKVFVPGCWEYPVVSKQFYLSNELSGHAFRLHFLGTAGNAEVFINGTSQAELLGTISGNHVTGSVNIATPRLKFGEMNTITVRLTSPQLTGPWFPFPGLIGEVYLEAVNSIVLGTPGIHTQITPEQGIVNLQVPIASTLPKGDVLNAQINMYDAFGNLAATNSLDLKVGEAGQAMLSGSLNIPQAHLWSPQDPYLYRLEVAVSGVRGERDSFSLPLGVREVKFQENKLLLNGQEFVPKILQRVNDTADSGSASNSSGVENDLRLAKQLGYNCLYIPDYTPEPYIYDVADRCGLLILSQVPVLGIPTDTSQRAAGVAQQSLNYHASFMAQGLGTGLDMAEAGVKEYVANAMKNGPVFYTTLGKPNLLMFDNGIQIEFNAPYLADFMNAQPSFAGKSSQAQVNSVGILSRERGEKKEQQVVKPQPSLPSSAPFILAIITLLLMLQSARVGNLRFIHITERLKRKIRQQVRLQFYWFLLRLSVISLVMVETLIQAQSKGYLDFWLHFIRSYPLQVCIRFLLITPWALFCFLISLGLLLSLITAYPRARTLEKQYPLALILWLEKRKRWVVLALAAWVYTFYGGPFWLVWFALCLGFCLSALSGGQDIRRVGGKTFAMAYSTLIGILLIAIVVFNWDLVKVSYHWYQLQGGRIWG
jgi:hypothetical protein